MRDGKLIDVDEMDINHLRNALKMVIRNLQIAKKGKGKAVMKKGVKYIEMDGKYYDYFSYINAGILIPEVI